ncbi:MAG: alpha/beta hydrolase [Lentisphaeria bacterium]|nr:alpha/beta hydrolase [Lentisphaeria bacterium]
MKRLLLLFGLCLACCVLRAEVHKNLPYYEKDSPRQGNLDYLESRCKLDLHLPDGQKNFPTLVWFHGGGLGGGSKYIPNELALDRMAVAAVNYRLSGKKAECPDYLYDAAAAVVWVRKHIAEYGGDPSKVYVAGHSAGGYLTVMLALAPEYLQKFGAKPHDFAGYFPISGQMTTHYRILGERREKGQNVPDVVLDEFAPIQRAGENAPPITLLVGDPEVEWASRVEENQLLYGRLKYVYKNKNVICHSFATFNHGSVKIPSFTVINSTMLPRKK